MKKSVLVEFKGYVCDLKIGEYKHPKGSPTALYLIGAEGTIEQGQNIATCTVNLIDRPITPKGWVYIKEYSENVGMTEALIASDVIYPETIVELTTGGYDSVVNLCKLKIEI